MNAQTQPGPQATEAELMLQAATTLAPWLREADALGELRARWADTRRMRIEDALAPGLADTLADAVFDHPFTFYEQHVNDVRCVKYHQLHMLPGPEETSDFAPMAAAMQLFQRDLPALASAITGQALHRISGEALGFDCYTKGSYLDAHTDQGPDRLIAYVVGLTRDTWPAEEGGHLEFLAPDETSILDRWAPGFGSLDLFNIYPLVRPHRIPLLQTHVIRLSVNGWLTGEIKGPWED